MRPIIGVRIQITELGEVVDGIASHLHATARVKQQHVPFVCKPTLIPANL